MSLQDRTSFRFDDWVPALSIAPHPDTVAATPKAILLVAMQMVFTVELFTAATDIRSSPTSFNSVSEPL